MDNMVLLSSVVIISLGLGVVTFFVLKKKLIKESQNIEEEQAKIIEEAKAKAATLLKEAKL